MKQGFFLATTGMFKGRPSLPCRIATVDRTTRGITVIEFCLTLKHTSSLAKLAGESFKTPSIHNRSWGVRPAHDGLATKIASRPEPILLGHRQSLDAQGIVLRHFSLDSLWAYMSCCLYDWAPSAWNLQVNVDE